MSDEYTGKRCEICKWYTPRNQDERNCCVTLNGANEFTGYCTKHPPTMLQPIIPHVPQWKGDPHLNNINRVQNYHYCGYYELETKRS